MNWTERRERFRAHLKGNRCIYPASVYDGIAARIAEEMKMLKTVMTVLACFSLLVSAGCAGKGVGKGKAPISTRG